MNMQVVIDKQSIDWNGCGHWSGDLPYRAIVPIKEHSAGGPMLYQIAGSEKSARGAVNALKLALDVHGGLCFYCRVSKADTIDHVEAECRDGGNELSNLVVACKACNIAKGHQIIEAYNARAGEEWLTLLSEQIARRLEHLRQQQAGALLNQASSPPQPKQGAATGP